MDRASSMDGATRQLEATKRIAGNDDDLVRLGRALMDSKLFRTMMIWWLRVRRLKYFRSAGKYQGYHCLYRSRYSSYRHNCRNDHGVSFYTKPRSLPINGVASIRLASLMRCSSHRRLSSIFLLISFRSSGWRSARQKCRRSRRFPHKRRWLSGDCPLGAKAKKWSDLYRGVSAVPVLPHTEMPGTAADRAVPARTTFSIPLYARSKYSFYFYLMFSVNSAGTVFHCPSVFDQVGCNRIPGWRVWRRRCISAGWSAIIHPTDTQERIQREFHFGIPAGG